MRLWDTLFSDPAGRTDCLLRICTAMLLNVRGQLLQARPHCPCASTPMEVLRAHLILMLHERWQCEGRVPERE